jgi:hypothetical protein
MSSNNRRQMATGLKALLGTARPLEIVDSFVQEVREGTADTTEPVPTATGSVEAANNDEAINIGAGEALDREEAPEQAPISGDFDDEPEFDSVVQRARPKRGVQDKPKHEASAARRLGTLEQPYLRQRDNQPTRKVGVVLRTDVAEQLQIFCVRTRQRPNVFIERAILAALDAEKPRNTRR